MLRGVTKSWWVAFVVAMLASLSLYLVMANGNIHGQLLDSDTTDILKTIRARHDPLSWFRGDWPLLNHFYRPIPSLLFELDNFLHPRSDFGFVFTNVTLCFLTTIIFFWYLREILDSPFFAAFGTVLFALWQHDEGWRLGLPCTIMAVVVLFGGLYRHSLKLSYFLPAILVWLWLGHEFEGITGLSFRMLTWIPGRTAGSMLVFGMLSMAAFARYLRLSPSRESGPPPATALDQPATKSTVVSKTEKPSIWWIVLSVVALSIALAAYEQAVMVPALLGWSALYFFLIGRKVEWKWGWAFGACLAGYLILRQSVISHEPSAYWLWQKRTLQTSLMMMQRYLFYPFRSMMYLFQICQDGALMWITAAPWLGILEVASACSAMWESRRRWLICGYGWLGSVLAYGPMAFYKDFDHYHYYPMAIRTIFVMGLAWVAVDLTAIALSRPALQAPKRLSPAPGSLHHP